MDLTGAEREKLEQVLAHALINQVKLNLVVQTALNNPLRPIESPNLTDEEAAFQLVEWAAKGAPDAILKLLKAAHDFVPDNPELVAINTYITQKTKQSPSDGALERVVHKVAGFVGVLEFRKRLFQAEAAVCRIEMRDGEGEGTGFLVGPDLVLTNYHVFDEVWENPHDPANIVVRFDYKMGQDGVSVPLGRACRLADDWKIAWSKQGDSEKELDFLLLRLSETPGSDPVAEIPGGQRGWLKPIGRDLENGEPLVILQHPRTRPMQIALGSVMNIDGPNKRIVHDVNTERGSSGSPCFDAQWHPVALHYYGSGAGNRAVQFAPILEVIHPLLTQIRTPVTIITPLLENYPGQRPVRVQPPRNLSFTGRETHLDNLHAKIKLAKIVALVGMPGIGKTEIAREFAQRYQAEYKAIFWLSAATRDSLLASFGLIARALKLRHCDQRDLKLMLGSVLEWLESHPGWLLVLDNADDWKMVMDVLRNGNDPALDFMMADQQGHVLFTSQSAAIPEIARILRINPMLPEEGALFLLRRAYILQDGQSLANARRNDLMAAHDLSKELGGLPLALDQAGAYVDGNARSLTEYYALYRSHQRQMNNQRGGGPGGRSDSVTVTFQLAFDKLELVNPAAADLMRLCAFLEPNEIPEVIFYDASRKTEDCGFGEHLEKVVTDEVRWDNTIKAGMDRALLWRNSANHTLTTHRVVQAVLRDEMSQQERQLWSRRAVAALRCTFPAVEYENWEKCDRLVPHAISCIRHTENEDSALQARAELLHEVAYFLSERGLYSEAEPLYKQAEKELQNARNSADNTQPNGSTEMLARCLHNLGWLYYKRWSHDREEALARSAGICYQKALRLWREGYSKKHHEYAWCLSTLAELLREQEKYGRSYLLYHSSIAIYEKLRDSLGQTQPEKYCNVAFSLAGLAEICSKRAQFKGQDAQFISTQFAEAEKHLSRALEIRQEHLAAGHPQLALNRIGLATLWWRRRAYQEATTEYRQGLGMLAKALGEAHQDVSWHRRQLLNLYLEQGLQQEAEDLYCKMLTLSLQALDSEIRIFLTRSGVVFDS